MLIRHDMTRRDVALAVLVIVAAFLTVRYVTP